MKSWKTTVIGVLTALGAGASAIKAFLEGDTDIAGTSVVVLVGALGHIFARDNNVSSEDAGIKPKFGR